MNAARHGAGALAVFILGSVATGTIQEPEYFVHGSAPGHVQDVWFSAAKPEVQRDCRGCHVYAESETRDPQAVCSLCHYDAFTLEARPGYEHDLSNLRDEVAIRGFRHHEHAELACKMCHMAGNLGAPARFVAQAEDLPIPQGFKHCAACHGKESRFDQLMAVTGNRLEGIEPGALEEGRFFERLNGDPAMGPGAANLGRFDHREHVFDVLAPARLEDFGAAAPPATAFETRCEHCHVPVTRARAADLGQAEFDNVSCARCHVRSGSAAGQRVPLGFVLREKEGLQNSATALTFAHGDHLKAEWSPEKALANPAGYTVIEERACGACHESDGAGFVLAATAWDYRQCLTCHDAGDWIAAGTSERHAGRGWWHGNWERCTQCHRFDGSEMETDRVVPAKRVARRRPTRFTLELQTHRGLSPPIDGDCSECHKADATKVPSRVDGAAFRHATHVPPASANDRRAAVSACDDCHGKRVNAARTTAELGSEYAGASASEELAGLTYDPARCVECHEGSAPVPSAWEEVAVELEFSHENHLGRVIAGRPIDCLTCHVGEPGVPEAGGAIGVLPEAKNCSLCHGHDARWASGEATEADLKSCEDCHRAAIPARGQEAFPVTRFSIVDVEAAQVHPPDGTCADCHVENPAAPLIRDDVPSDRVLARNSNPHVNDQARGWNQKGPPGSDCLDCHWARFKESMSKDPTARRSDDGSDMTSKNGGPYPGQAIR